MPSNLDSVVDIASNGVTPMFDEFVTMVTTVANTIVSSPLLLIFALVSLVGIGIGIFKRLFYR